MTVPDLYSPSPAATDAAMAKLLVIGLHHGWFAVPTSNDLDPIAKSEFGGGVQDILIAAHEAEQKAEEARRAAKVRAEEIFKRVVAIADELLRLDPGNGDHAVRRTELGAERALLREEFFSLDETV